MSLPDTMIGAFNFNNQSSQSFGLVSRSVKRPLLPSAKPKRVELPGASGAYDFEGLEYGVRFLTMQIAYVGANYYELRKRARRIAAWLSTDGWCRLILDDENDIYYLAKVTEGLDFNSLWESGMVDVTFDCQPFAYSVQTENVPAGNFINPGTRHIDFRSPPGSRFLITASVGNSASFTMNGRVLTYTGAAGILTIDSVNMEARMDNQNVFGCLGGDIDLFFQILPGTNNITAVGALNVNVQYIPMWY